MHITRYLLPISLFLFTLLVILLGGSMIASAAPTDDCFAYENACYAYEVCNDNGRCRRVVCDIDDTHCNEEAIEDGGELISWSPDHHEDYHDWAWYEDSEIVLRLDLEGSDQSLHRLADDITREYNVDFDENNGKIYREGGIILVTTTEDGWSAAEQLHDDPRILYAEPNVVGDPPKATKGNSIWAWGDNTGGSAPPEHNTTLLQLESAHGLSMGEDIVVAVIDTGIALSHPWFTDILVDGYDFIENDGCPDEYPNNFLVYSPYDLSEYDLSDGEETNCPPDLLTVALSSDFLFADDSLYGHGTHVAGIVNQVAPHAKIMPLRALDTTGVGSIVPVAEAILHAAEQCADIINLSMGTPYSSFLLEDVVNEVTQPDAPIRANCEGKPLTIVASAGNTESDTPYYPAAYDNVIAVTSSNPNSTFGSNESFESDANYGDWVTISAPGIDIYSSVPYGRDTLYNFIFNQPCDPNDANYKCEGDYGGNTDMMNHCVFGPVATVMIFDALYTDTGLCDFWSGTSMATPFVAGSAALISSVSDSSADGIRSLIVNTATPMAGDKEAAELAGSGIVSPLYALSSLDTIAPSQPPLQVAVSDVGVAAAVDGLGVALLTIFGLTMVTVGVRIRWRVFGRKDAK